MTSNAQRRSSSGWLGWIVFAAIMLGVVGVFNIIDGLVALTNHQAYLVTQRNLIAFDFTAWGWILLVLGIVQVLVGIFLYRGALLAMLAAVFILVLDSIAQLSFITAYPLWSITVIVLNAVILWAICVHGDEVEHGVHR